MTALFKNNAYSTLASGITDVATSISLTASEGARFPSPTGSDFFYATLIDTSNNLEIVKCTTRSTDTLTVTRAQESTTGLAYSAGDRIELRVTAAGLTETVTASQAAQTAAEAAQTAAEAALDTFDDRYLGTFTTAAQPTVDNDGDPLVDGAIYFDTTLNTMMTYDLGNTTWLQMKPTAAEQANIDIVAADSTVINTVAGDTAVINTVAGDTVVINTVAGDTVVINTVAGDTVPINTVAGDTVPINTVAGDTIVINTVAGDTTVINTVAGISANVTTVAGISANVTTVAGISANVTTVAGISADVTSVAAIAADVTTAAANVADITNFADVYLGPAASDPATRTDTSALQDGDLYFNTTSDQMMVYGSSAWGVVALTTAAVSDIASEEAVAMAIALG